MTPVPIAYIIHKISHWNLAINLLEIYNRKIAKAMDTKDPVIFSKFTISNSPD